MLDGDSVPDFVKRRVATRMNADPSIWRGRRQQLRVMRGAALNIAHDLFGFRLAAMGHEPARTFRNGVAEKNHDQPQHRADGESHPPAEADGNNAGIEQPDDGGGADGGADPEAGIDDQVNAAADAGGNQLVDGGVDSRIFAADARAGKRAKQRVGREVPGESSQRRGAEIKQKSRRVMVNRRLRPSRSVA